MTTPIWMMELLLLCILVCGATAERASRISLSARNTSAHSPAAVNVPITKLGTYDYMTYESSPLVFNGALLMFESMAEASPQWAGHWDPRFVNCSCYYRMRDLMSGRVIVNITETCNHAFGAALVVSNAVGLDTVYIFGTPWIRYGSPRNHRRGDVEWDGPCNNNNCTVDAFWSSDPKLVMWNARFPAARPVKLVYNNDVTHISAPSTAVARARSSDAALPPHQWIMAIEAGVRTEFALSNSSDPTDPEAWTFLDPSVYILPQFGIGDIGQCPSIRYDPATGWYYVLTGGNTIRVLRTADLRNWTLANNHGVILPPSVDDCNVAPQEFAHYKPTGDAIALLENCKSTNSSIGFGNDSDVDLTEAIVDGILVTLFQHGANNQKSFGFGNLAIHYGGMFEFLDSLFP